MVEAAAGSEARMAVWHFSCDKWLGEDKSADPLFDIIAKELDAYIGRRNSGRGRSSFSPSSIVRPRTTS